MATKQSRMHGRVEGARAKCAVPGCDSPGEFKAPLQPANFDGPGAWRFLCLDHVREHNSDYNYFEGMSPDEITRAQSPLAGWERASRPFAANEVKDACASCFNYWTTKLLNSRRSAVIANRGEEADPIARS